MGMIIALGANLGADRNPYDRKLDMEESYPEPRVEVVKHIDMPRFCFSWEF